MFKAYLLQKLQAQQDNFEASMEQNVSIREQHNNWIIEYNNGMPMGRTTGPLQHDNNLNNDNKYRNFTLIQI